MAFQTINIGSVANDGSGDPLRTAMDKVNDNFGVAGTGVFNVMHPNFGAVGDGVTDDRNAFQAAFNAANAAGGGVVFMPPGIFRMAKPSGTLTMYSNTTLRGVGDNSIIFHDDRWLGKEMISLSPPPRRTVRTSHLVHGSSNRYTSACKLLSQLLSTRLWRGEQE